MPLAVPPPLPDHPAPGFPWLGALAPVGASALLFAVTSSPFALVFAALGPLTAVAAVVDGARQRRSVRRRDRARRSEALTALSVAVDRELDDRRRAAEAAAPSTRSLVGVPRPIAPLDPGAARPLRIGRADLDSGIRLEAVEPEDTELVRAAATLTGAPLVVDASGGVAVLGAPSVREAFAETLRAQLSWRAGGAPAAAHVVSAGRLEDLPRHCAVLLRLDGPARGEVVRSPKLAELGAFVPEILSRPERQALASSRAGTLPERVDLLQLPAATRGASSAVFAVDEDGPVEVDLVRDGPHALVGGTTGSGKSELLVSWILALTAERTPAELSLLLFDFKGGAAFDPLVRLPHVAGLVTDLDGALVDRAAAALGAELRSREERLRAHRARSADEVPGLGRLVIVVDEFATLLAERRELHDLFVDIAARGRSLGVHLILCTQRPAGVVRDSLAANCALRLSLRVVDAADSTAVVGDASAADIPRTLPGRCVIALHGETPRRLQVATVGREELDRVVDERARAAAGAVAPVWLPPLPSRIAFDDLPGTAGGVPFGLSDRPEELRQPAAVWRPELDGALAIVGAAGSGRSTAARTIARSLGADLLNASTERLGDALLGSGTEPLVVDDADVLLERMSAEHRAACLDALASVVQRRERRVAMTLSSPLTPTGRAVLAALACRLVLRVASADEHRLLVGSGMAFDARVPAGRAVWEGARTQVADTPAISRIASAEPFEHALTAPSILVTGDVDGRLAALRCSGVDAVDGRDGHGLHAETGEARIVVIDPAGWQSAVSLWSSLGRVDTVYEGCTVAEYRAVSRDRALPPVLDAPDRVWLVRPGRAAVRARWTVGA